MDNQLHNLLLRSFDDELTLEEQNLLEEGLRQSEELRAAKKELLAIEDNMSKFSFGYTPNFENDVLLKLNGKSEVIESNWMNSLVSFFPKVAFSGLALIAVFLIIIYSNEGMLSWETLLGIENLTGETAQSISWVEF